MDDSQKYISMMQLQMRVEQLERDRERLDQRFEDHPKGPLLQRVEILERDLEALKLDRLNLREEISRAKLVIDKAKDSSIKSYWMIASILLTAILTVFGSVVFWFLERYFRGG